jgi:hypothetical protein
LLGLTGLFELGLELGAAIDLDGLDRERHLGMTFSRKADAAAARLKALPSGAVLTNRVSIWIRPPALSGLRSGGRRTAKRRLAHRLRAAFVDEMSDASFELQPHLEGGQANDAP